MIEIEKPSVLPIEVQKRLLSEPEQITAEELSRLISPCPPQERNMWSRWWAAAVARQMMNKESK